MNTFLRRALFVGAALSALSLAPHAQAQVVISQVYGGGGSSSTTPVPSFKYDFVELYNNGTTAVTLVGDSIQYASATGTFSTGSSALFAFPAGASIAAGGYYLVRFGTASTYTGADLPNYDGSSTSIALSGTNGKVALAGNATAVTASTSAVGSPTTFSSNVIDFVGYGSANAYESTVGGVGGVGALSTTTAAVRNSVAGVYTDTNNNLADFTVTTPVPHYSGGLAAAPEPSGMVALALGAGVLGLMVARRRTAGQSANG